MTLSMRAIAICFSTAVLAGCGGRGVVMPTQTQIGNPPEVADPTFLTLPSRDVDFASLDAQRDASRTIRFYSGSVKSPLDDVVYSYRIVGSDPTKSNATTNIRYKPFLLRVHFPDGVVLDPTKPGCGDTISVENRVFDGPSFRPVPLTSNGVSLGKVQITDGFQRAEFWKILKGTGYHTVLKTAGASVVDVTAPDDSSTRDGACAGSEHRVGLVDMDAMNGIIISLAEKHAKANQIALFLTYNVLETAQGGCCIGGFHSAFGPDGARVYTIAAYTDSGVFRKPESADIYVLNHELGDVLNDPFPESDTKINLVPPWGGIGQVSKGRCQNNLEAGDPLTGTSFDVSENGFTYHPQDLAFFSWFYRTKSVGTGDAFSFNGTLKDTQGLCISE